MKIRRNNHSVSLSELVKGETFRLARGVGETRDPPDDIYLVISDGTAYPKAVNLSQDHLISFKKHRSVIRVKTKLMIEGDA